MAVYSTADPLRVLLLRLSDELRPEDESRMRFLLVDVVDARSDMRAAELFSELKSRGLLTDDDLSFVRSLLDAILRKDLSLTVAQCSREGIVMKEELSQKYPLSSYRKFLVSLSCSLESQDVKRMTFLWNDTILPRTQESISSALLLFTALEQHGIIGPQKLENLRETLDIIPRKDLVKKLDTFVSEENGQGNNKVVPSSFGLRHLPADYVNRSSDVEQVKRLLLSGQSSVGVVGARGKDVVGIKGMGGIGKTVLAQAVCWEIRSTRQVIWINVGQTPQLLSLLNMVATAISGKQTSFSDKVKAQDWIQENTVDKDSLVVLDDVWDVEHASAFDVLSGNCQLLITTRNSEVVHGLRGSELHKLGALSKDQARQLLAKCAKVDLNRLPREIKLVVEQILEECGGLPLAIALIGSSLVETQNEQAWRDRLEELQDADLEGVRSCFPKDVYPYEHLMAAIDVSFKALPEQYRTWYLDLAVFPEDTEMPSHVLEMMWNNASFNRDAKQQRKLQRRVREALRFLEKRSMLQSGTTEGSYLVHDILLDYLQGKIAHERGESALNDAHIVLLDRYKSKCDGEGWSGGPKGDMYFFKNLAHHLCAAGRTHELVRELSNFEWLQNKLEETDLAFLLSDFTSVKEKHKELELIRSALVLSSNVVNQRKQQLGPQLLGRLLGFTKSENVSCLVNQIKQRSSHSAPSFVPVNACLSYPGGPLIRTTDSRSRTIMAIVVTPDRKRIITGATDGNIKVWDFDSGKELNTLSGHTKVVHALALSQNGRLLVSGSFDLSLKVWNIDNMENVKTIHGHKDCVNGVLLSPDGQRIVSCSKDSTIQLWDLGSATWLHTFNGHAGPVDAVAMAANGNHVVSGSEDSTVKLWNLNEFTLEKTFRGHSGIVYTVCFSPDETHVVSGSEDKTVKIWDVSSDEPVRSLTGHTGSIYGVAMTPDGRKVLSGSEDMSIRVWWFDSGKEACILQGHSEAVRTVTVTGSIALSGSEDRTYKMWDLECNQTTPLFAGHRRSINDVAMSTDASMCVSVSDDGLVKVWDCRCVDEVTSLKGSSEEIYAASLHPHGALVAFGGLDCQVKLWDMKGEQELCSFTGHDHPIQVLKFVKDGDVLVSASRDNTFALWDWKNGSNLRWIKASIYHINDFVLVGEVLLVCNGYNKACSIRTDTLDSIDPAILTGPDSRPYPAQVRPDGSYIFSGSNQLSSFLRSWVVKTSFEVRIPCSHPENSMITALAVTSDGQDVITCSNHGSITKVHLEDGAVLMKYAFSCRDGSYITDVVLMPPDEQNFVTSDFLGDLKLWSADGSPPKILRKCEAGVAALCLLPNDRIAAVDEKGKIHLISVKEVSQAAVIDAHSEPINALAVQAEEEQLLATGSDDKSLKIWKISDSKNIPSCDLVLAVTNAHPHKVTALSFVEGSSSLISGSLDNILIQWDLNDGHKVREFCSTSFGVNCIWSLNDQVISCFYDSTATVWCLSEGIELQRVLGHRGQHHVSKVSPDGKQVFSDSVNYTVKRWSLKGRAQTLSTFRGHTDEVIALCLAPDERHVITGSRDKTVKMWRVEDSELLSEFYFEQAVKVVTLSADGKMAAVGLHNGQLCLLNVKY